jgi:hypothetical protein
MVPEECVAYVSGLQCDEFRIASLNNFASLCAQAREGNMIADVTKLLFEIDGFRILVTDEFMQWPITWSILASLTEGGYEVQDEIKKYGTLTNACKLLRDTQNVDLRNNILHFLIQMGVDSKGMKLWL